MIEPGFVKAVLELGALSAAVCYMIWHSHKREDAVMEYVLERLRKVDAHLLDRLKRIDEFLEEEGRGK